MGKADGGSVAGSWNTLPPWPYVTEGPLSRSRPDQVWDLNYEGDPNVVEVYIGYLRRKIDALGIEHCPLSVGRTESDLGKHDIAKRQTLGDRICAANRGDRAQPLEPR